MGFDYQHLQHHCDLLHLLLCTLPMCRTSHLALTSVAIFLTITLLVRHPVTPHGVVAQGAEANRCPLPSGLKESGTWKVTLGCKSFLATNRTPNLITVTTLVLTAPIGQPLQRFMRPSKLSGVAALHSSVWLVSLLVAVSAMHITSNPATVQSLHLGVTAFV